MLPPLSRNHNHAKYHPIPSPLSINPNIPGFKSCFPYEDATLYLYEVSVLASWQQHLTVGTEQLSSSCVYPYQTLATTCAMRQSNQTHEEISSIFLLHSNTNTDAVEWSGRSLMLVLMPAEFLQCP